MYFLKRLFSKPKNGDSRFSKSKNGDSRKEALLKDIYKKPSIFVSIKPLPTCVLLGFCVLAVLVCFVGQSPAGPRLFTGCTARQRIVAEHPFTYTSTVRTQELKRQAGLRLPPVYNVDLEPVERVQSFLGKFEALLTSLEPKLKLGLGSPNPEEGLAGPDIEEGALQYLEEALASFAPGSSLRADIVLRFLQGFQAPERTLFFKEGVDILSAIAKRGIEASSSLDLWASEGSLRMKEVGGAGHLPYLSKNEALRALRLQLYSLDYEASLLQWLYMLLKDGLEPNLVYDAQATQKKLDEALSKIAPVEVIVPRGQLIVAAGTTVNDYDYEALEAYRQSFQAQNPIGLRLHTFLLPRLLATLLIVGTTILYIKIALPSYKSSKRYRLLPALLVLMNLSAIRLVLELGGLLSGPHAPLSYVALPFALPLAFAPILTSLLIGPRPGLWVAVVVGAFSALMQGGDLATFFIYSVSGLVAVYLARHTRQRSRILVAGLVSGLFFGFTKTTIAYCEHEALAHPLLHLTVAVLAGGLSSSAAIALRPLFEDLFSITTDFTLLELTDFNHPILRRLQLEAPGTYHHSLMVANLAERAACAIGANPLLCRSGALFHDMGKLLRPSYFIENQNGEENPHEALTPTMSAIIIKSHVKEGLDLAQEAGLPPPIRDILREHHGTTLTEYFYQKALQKAQAEHQEAVFVDANAFRYEGPRPQSKESAIVFFADSIEASSRSLKKINHQSLTELIDTIFKERMAEHQLDECPLTLAEIYTIKESFTFTLINTFHARLSYTDFPAKAKAKPST